MTRVIFQPRLFVDSCPESAGKRVAQIIATAITENPAINLGLATGGTPVAVYRDLVERYRKGEVSFAEVTSFNLDEYLGLPPNHPQSFRYFMNEHLFEKVDINLDQTFFPSTDLSGKNLPAQYDTKIQEQGGIDLQLLGIGTNGHIAFNEPGSDPESDTRVVQLTDETIDSNSRFFESPQQVPRQAITMGIGSILRAKQIILLATGSSKSAAIKRMIEGTPHPSCPASFLLHHKNVTIVIDENAHG